MALQKLNICCSSLEDLFSKQAGEEQETKNASIGIFFLMTHVARPKEISLMLMASIKDCRSDLFLASL